MSTNESLYQELKTTSLQVEHVLRAARSAEKAEEFCAADELYTEGERALASFSRRLATLDHADFKAMAMLSREAFFDVIDWLELPIQARGAA